MALNYTDWSPIYDDLAEGISNGERSNTGNPNWNPLMTIHPTNVWFDATPAALAANFFGNRTWLTLNACQSGHTDFPPDVPLSWWNARRGYEPVGMMYATGEAASGTKRPAIDNEAHYEYRYDDGTKGADLFYWNASDVRKGSWQSVFSGAAGVTYGENNVMQFYNPIYNTQGGSGPASPWYVDIDFPGAAQMQYISKAITDRGKDTYYKRIPAQDLIVGDAGMDDTYVAAYRDRGGTWIMVYTPTGEPFTINIDSLKTKKITSNWYDPTSGTYTAFTLSTSGSTIEFTPPTSINHTDWTLVLESE